MKPFSPFSFTIYVKLLPIGKFAKAGFYSKLGTRTLRFDGKLAQANLKNYETMQVETMYTFSMCGFQNKSHSGDQRIEEIVTVYRDRVPAEKLDDFDHLINIWRNYHLNDLTAGSKAQEDALKEWRKTNQYYYDEACEYLKSIGLYEDNGYKYGSSWLARPLPQEEVEFLNRIIKEWSVE